MDQMNLSVQRSEAQQELIEMAKNSKEAARITARLSAEDKNKVLKTAAAALLEHQNFILAENQKDVAAAVAAGMKDAFIDRLTLKPGILQSMAEGLVAITALNDPVGEMVFMKTLPNGLVVGQKRVPLGVIGIIYESRPNVTADAFGLCFKAGSAVILRGGKEAISSNKAIVVALKKGLEAAGLPGTALQLVEDTSRESSLAMMKLNQYIDLLIPRGGAGLIRSVVENSTVPVIETGTGNCHIFVDESADLTKAVEIILNAKTQRPGVCNACEKLLLHKNIADHFLPIVCKALKEKNVEIRGDETVCHLVDYAVAAVEEDWPLEYEDYIIGVRVVDGIQEAISHIARYSSGHSEAILTENYSNAQLFLNEVDSAAVYVNASTRFTDGFEFGFGAEIGISTQKLHARGPMGLKEMTTTKFVIYGNGQIRK